MWGSFNLSITAKNKLYFSNASVNLSAVKDDECWVEVSSAAELNFYSDNILHYVLLTNIKQGSIATQKSSASSDE